MPNNKMGTLYVVATPIGNLKDMTWRAVEVLKQVDKIAAEDTRHTAPLLNHYSIHKPTLSLHEFNERERVQMILELLRQGESIALTSDAGTPLISDPGFHLVREARAQGFNVVPIPGACAAITALSVAGLPTDRFSFEGFLPAKQEACRHRLETLTHETRTMVFFEAPRRLLATLQNMVSVFGATRKAVVARELTKLYETVLSDSLEQLVQHFTANPEALRGEAVILVSGLNEAESLTRAVIPEQVLDILLVELPVKQAAALASKITGERKNVLYELALEKVKGR